MWRLLSLVNFICLLCGARLALARQRDGLCQSVRNLNGVAYTLQTW